MVGMIAATIGVLFVAVLGLAATKPDTFRVQRSIGMKAPPEKVFTHVNDLKSGRRGRRGRRSIPA